MILLTGCSSNTELEWHSEEGYRWAEVSPGWWGEPGFEGLSSAQTGINFINKLSEKHIAENQNLLNGSGVAAGDVDGDGRTDLYFAGLDSPNRLYKNMGGLEFRDITRKAGVAHEGRYSTGVVMADVDGDTDPDLLVTSMSGKNALYLNDGKGAFQLKKDSGLGEANGSMTMALADIEGDGDLDLYVANYKEKSVKDLYDLMEITWDKTVRKEGDSYRLVSPYDEHFTLIPGEPVPDRRELGTRDELYINDGSGRFTREENPGKRFLNTEDKALGLQRDWGLTAKFQDINGDGHPDLYVCNDFWTPDRVWINRGDGTFRPVNDYAIRKFSFSSMAVDFSDINRDGALDFFVTEMLSPEHQKRMRQAVTASPFTPGIGEIDNQPQYMRNTLYLKREDQTYAEIAQYSGVDASGWSWATHFMDIDLDGYEDLLINTGNAHDVQDLDTQERLTQQMMKSQQAPKGYILEYPSLQLRNRAYRNNRDLTFADKSEEWGFTEEDIAHGFASADLDNDGDLDFAVNRLNSEALVYENRTTAPRIAVRLKGGDSNTQGIGATIELTGGPVPQRKQLVSGGDYLSGSDPAVVFAAGADSANPTLTVTWPDGAISIIDTVRSNRIYEVAFSSSVSKEADSNTETKDTLFKDVSGKLNHTHHEEAFNDDGIQRLVPYKLSRLGPGVSWIDVDGDSDHDLLIGTGRGGQMAVFENNGDSSFKSKKMPFLTDTASGDQTAIVGWKEADRTRVIVGSSSLEEGTTRKPSAYVYSINKKGKVAREDISASVSATGPLAAADYDHDGDVDFFLGGRFVPAHYPMDAGSRLFKNEQESFLFDQANAEVFKNLGLVTGAVFVDYDGDGDADLLCSLEWGAVKLFENRKGSFRDVTEDMGLASYKGWWNGMATGDFNNDGRMDFVATNLGMNSTYQAESDSTVKIFYDDFDGDRRIEIIESYYDPKIGAYVPRYGLYSLHNAISTITQNVKSHKQYGNSSLETILGKKIENIPSKEITTSNHMLFMNEGDRFSARPLPVEAQFTAAFYAGVADVDNDGNEDLFLSQNLFAVPPLVSRLDAGRGLWLKGDGKGNLSAVPGSESGIKVYGEQRGAALGDFNRDGKVDLAVSQNGAATKLYENRTARAGLIVRLDGPEKNGSAIGSGIRLVYEDGQKGPRRVVQAGSGYWSQNSATQVMGIPKQKTSSKIEVTWFDGTLQEVDIVEGKNEYVIAYPRNP